MGGVIETSLSTWYLSNGMKKERERKNKERERERKGEKEKKEREPYGILMKEEEKRKWVNSKEWVFEKTKAL